MTTALGLVSGLAGGGLLLVGAVITVMALRSRLAAMRRAAAVGLGLTAVIILVNAALYVAPTEPIKPFRMFVVISAAVGAGVLLALREQVAYILSRWQR